mgnify:CR=1 FL=1
MADYLYECPTCQEVHTAEYQIGLAPQWRWCRVCRDKEVDTIERKVITAPSINFKGEGFYCTDNEEKRA